MQPTEEDLKRDAEEDLESFTLDWEHHVFPTSIFNAFTAYMRRAVYAETRVKELEEEVKTWKTEVSRLGRRGEYD